MKKRSPAIALRPWVLNPEEELILQQIMDPKNPLGKPKRVFKKVPMADKATIQKIKRGHE